MKNSKDLKKKYGVHPESEAGLVVIVGHPSVHYRRVLQRRFGEVRYWDEARAT
jgi:hypothetical protein